MNLVIDLGNTMMKVAVLDKGKILERFITNVTGWLILSGICARYPVKRAILSSVVKDASEITGYLERHFQFLEFTHTTCTPVTLLYETPETLGPDRLASVIGANHLYPGKNVLVIDAGTCIKYDLITSDAAYHGGAISPGISIRYKSLHNFTGRLPLLKSERIDYLIGKTTTQSIHSGVLNGVYAEVDGIIAEYKALYPELVVLMTGGDLEHFEGKLKNAIFAVPDLLFTGLNIILDYNAEE